MTALVKVETRVAAQAVVQEPQQYLTFMLAAELFAIGILRIKEIIEYGQLTRVPMMPRFIRGVINMRGSVVPVVDLSVRFGHPPMAVTRRTCIVVLEMNDGDFQQDIGIVVDSVSEVLEIPANMVEPAPTFGAKIRTDFIQGMGKVNDRFVIILNVLNVLSVEEMSELTRVSQTVATQSDETH